MTPDHPVPSHTAAGGGPQIGEWPQSSEFTAKATGAAGDATRQISRPTSCGEPTRDVVIVSETFELEFRGEPGPALRAAFPEFTLRPELGMTLLRGEFVDQAALHGVIERVNSLGLELVGLHLLVDDDKF